MINKVYFCMTSYRKPFTIMALRYLKYGIKADIFIKKSKYGVLETSYLRSKSPKMVIQ